MTVRFGNYRLAFYLGVFLLSGVVLGLAANFASIFFPKYHHDFIIYSLFVSSFTIFMLLLSLQWAQPQTEAILLGVLVILWLTMGAWATDIIGISQCDALGGQTTPSKSGTANAQTYCYEMKVVQAFSWALFIGFVLALYILFQLVDQARRFGRYSIWSDPIRELPWFGEMPGYYNTHAGGPGQTYTPAWGYGYPYPPPMSGGLPLMSGVPPNSGGHSIVIRPNLNGPPDVTQHQIP